ncbi:MAG: hypothetical protein WCY62_06645 [Clostridia bacterium]
MKKSGKKILLICLVILLLCVLSSCIEAKDTPTPATSEFKYSNGVITGFTGNAAFVIIPAKIDGNEITGIASNAFKGCEYMTSITIPANITGIEGQPFDGFQFLNSILVSEGSYADQWCRDNGYAELIQYID